MEIIKINESSLLITLGNKEAKRYFPKGEFDLSSAESRMALRAMLNYVSGQTGRDFSGKVEISAFGSVATGFNVFCALKGGEAT